MIDVTSVRREDLLDLQTYEEQRDEIRRHMFQVKGARRIHVGDCLMFLFENHETVRYQVLEMMRAERLFQPGDLDRELRTYNALLGGEGELGCTLMIEIDDPAVRRVRMREWRDLPDRLYVALEDGRRVRPAIDESQRDAEQLSAVQFLKFDTGGEIPVAIGSDFETLTVEAQLSDAQRGALRADMM